MPAFIDLTGQVFGRLTVVERVKNDKHNRSCWLCSCSCGKEKIAVGNHLKCGYVKSCGCLQMENYGLPGGRWTKEEEDILRKSYSHGQKYASQKLGRSVTAVQSKAAQIGIQSMRQKGLGKKHLKLRHRFGINLYDYQRMQEEQNGVCAICGNPETRIHQNGLLCSLAVDHNHETKAIRGLLCQQCNLMIGNALEDERILFNAIQYLRSYNDA